MLSESRRSASRPASMRGQRSTAVSWPVGGGGGGAGRRVMVLLDDARDAEQARPLVPGSAGCLVVVTSRNQLIGLVAREGAHPLRLPPPSHAEARELLVRRLGDERIAAQPQA